MNASPIRALLGLGLFVAFTSFTSVVAAAAPVVKVTEAKDALEITIDGRPFTTYHYAPTADDPEWHRPYFFPVLSSDGVSLTADRDRETMGQEKREHPWHRSVWVGQGDANGIDHWTHPKSGKKLQRHLKFTRIDADAFIEELAWDGKDDGKPLLNETRTVKFAAYADGSRLIDVTSVFSAPSGDVEFKVKPLNVTGVEGGWLAVRVSGEISTNKASVISSSAGATGEKDARTQPAKWCDYSGPIGGKIFGVAEFDDPVNPGHPTPFHVREQGLLTHLGIHDWTLKTGASRRFRHGLLFHSGDAKSAQLEERYSAFVGSPTQ